jgi:virulence factor
MGRIKIAFIGAGGMANLVHYPSLHSIADAEIAGISDLM